MATLKLLTEGQEFIDSILYSLPSHRMVHRGYLPQDVANRLLADVRDVPAQRPQPQPPPRAAQAAQPAAQAAQPAAQAAPAPGGNLGDPGVGTKRNRFEAMYRACNGTGMTRNDFMNHAIARLEMTRAGATTYMGNAAREHGPWRLA